MKTVFRLSLFAIFLVSVSSCTKSSVDNNTFVTTKNTDPVLDSKIYHFINDPAPMELGTTSAVIQTGNTMTIYLPYAMDNEQLQGATLTLTDDATGDPVNTFELMRSTDPSAAQLNPPDGLRDVPFMFITFTTDSNYSGKTISISTSMVGNHLTSNDTISAAFSVTP